MCRNRKKSINIHRNRHSSKRSGHSDVKDCIQMGYWTISDKVILDHLRGRIFNISIKQI